MNKYYAAFDFANKRVGFALAAQHSQDVCEVDLPLDITHVHSSQGGSLETDLTDPVPSPVQAPPPVESPAPPPSTAPRPTIPEVTAPDTDRDPYQSDVFTSKQQQQPKSEQQYAPATQNEDDGRSLGHIVFLFMILGIGLTALVSVVHRRRKRVEGEKFQEMVSRAERGLGARSDPPGSRTDYGNVPDPDDGEEDNFVLDFQTLQRMN